MAEIIIQKGGYTLLSIDKNKVQIVQSVNKDFDILLKKQNNEVFISNSHNDFTIKDLLDVPDDILDNAERALGISKNLKAYKDMNFLINAIKNTLTIDIVKQSIPDKHIPEIIKTINTYNSDIVWNEIASHGSELEQIFHETMHVPYEPDVLTITYEFVKGDDNFNYRSYTVILESKDVYYEIVTNIIKKACKQIPETIEMILMRDIGMNDAVFWSEIINNNISLQESTIFTNLQETLLPRGDVLLFKCLYKPRETLSMLLASLTPTTSISILQEAGEPFLSNDEELNPKWKEIFFDKKDPDVAKKVFTRLYNDSMIQANKLSIVRSLKNTFKIHNFDKKWIENKKTDVEEKERRKQLREAVMKTPAFQSLVTNFVIAPVTKELYAKYFSEKTFNKEQFKDDYEILKKRFPDSAMPFFQYAYILFREYSIVFDSKGVIRLCRFNPDLVGRYI